MARWKAVERDIAKLIGGKRTNRDKGSGVEDITHPILSVEVKHGLQIPLFVKRTIEQAETNAPEGKIPIIALHPFGYPVSRSLVCMTLESLTALLQLVSATDQVSESPPTPSSGES